MPVDTLTAPERQWLTRLETVTITEPGNPGAECGFTTEARNVARTVCRALRGTQWRAEARAPYWPHPANEIHAQIVIVVDRRWIITFTHRVPAHTDRDMFTLTVNGRPVPYHRNTGDLPFHPEVIAANVRRHVTGTTFTGGCTSLTCTSTPTVATYGRAAYCAEHAARYAETGR
ncbi:MAG: hypothetical protein JXA67_10770 [Micromonosporaceae bacterium]|nr:hypothetical protein [Micromonosporaceae bacterium]